MIVFFAILLCPVLQQELALEGEIKHEQETQLDTIFIRDETIGDHKSDYRVEGDVEWRENGALLSATSSIERPTNSSWHADFQLWVDLTDQLRPQSDSDFRIWLIGDKDLCYVRTRSMKTNEGEVAATIALVNVGERDGIEEESVARELPLPNGLNKSLTIQCRHGLVAVSSGETQILLAFVETKSERIDAVRLEARRGNFEIRGLSGTLEKAPPSPLPLELRPRFLIVAAANEDRFNRVQQGKFDLAAEHAEIMAKQLELMYGKHDPRSLDAMLLLADDLTESEQVKKAETIYLELLKRQANALTPNHPSYAATLRKYADLLDKMDRSNEAQERREEAEQIERRVLGM